MQKNEITFLTPESVSVLYEALSTKTKFMFFIMKNTIVNMENNEKLK